MPRAGSDNRQHAHRHARHALEDFRTLRPQLAQRGDLSELLHSISHHLRHAVYRTGLEVDDRQVRTNT
jgi:hypothetical protein